MPKLSYYNQLLIDMKAEIALTKKSHTELQSSQNAFGTQRKRVN